jgi:lycopene beta-cyclase
VRSIQIYDVVIAGAGAAGLSLAWSIRQQPGLNHTKILVIDRNLVPKNDKTWCFWDLSLIPDTSIIHSQWQHMQVSAGKSLFSGTLRETTYACLRSEHFSRYMLDLLKQQSGITLLEADISGIRDELDFAVISTSEGDFTGKLVFQSVRTTIRIPSRFGLLQHFVGFEITAEKPCFNPASMTLMDFRVPQHNGTGFMYVLPTAADQALIEYTQFSQQLLHESQYIDALQAYIRRQFSLEPGQYHINRVEKGVIPMSEATYETRSGRHVHNIGAASGLTKPSTGYAFTRILRQSKAIAEQLSRGETPDTTLRSPLRFRFYDLLLLDILRNEVRSAEGIFAALFRQNPMDDVLRFLEERTDLATEIGIFTSLPWGPFIRSLTRNLPYVVTGRF